MVNGYEENIQNYLKIVFESIGKIVELRLKNDTHIIYGIFESYSKTQKKIKLIKCCYKEIINNNPIYKKISKLEYNLSEISYFKVKSVNNEFISNLKKIIINKNSFIKDKDIAVNKLKNDNKVLTKFNITNNLDDDDLNDDNDNNHFDQFAHNESKYNLEDDYNEEYYTTKLDIFL